MKVTSTEEFKSAEIRRNRIIALCFAVGLSLCLLLLITLLDLHLYWMTISLVGFLATWWIERELRPTQESALSYLHNKYPDFEFSLRNNESIEEPNLLEKLQRKRIQKRLEATELTLPPSRPIINRLAVVAGTVLLIPLIFNFVTTDNRQMVPTVSNDEQASHESFAVPDSAYIDQVKLKVQAPAYTKKRGFISGSMEQRIPEGSDLTWSFKRRGPIESVDFKVGDKQEKITTQFEQVEYKAEKSFLYYYVVQDSLKQSNSSPYYSITVEEDQQPVATISDIEEYQKLPWKENYDIDFQIDLTDDYGLEDAFLSATVAKGSGESVQFREKKFELNRFKSGKSSYSGRYQFSTKEFDMEPGSELYFYVMVKDNCPYRIQAAKTTTFFVVLEDTASYEYFDDAGMQVDLMPDFFRSQRQIIIDTEKLIEERGSISEQEFKRRSNELGFDQKMLRLKYGQFLGEEAESGIAIENEIEEDHDHEGDHDHDDGGMEDILNQYGHAHDHEAEEGELLATKGTEKEDPKNPSWVQELSHSHDNAEENTYFEISLKTKLKAALSVMWDSELHLRLYEPKTSLPFQYQALGFLEEIKNHARVYVHRIGFDPPAIKVAEKRLTGEQKEIADPQTVLERTQVIDRKHSKEFIDHFSAIDADDLRILDGEERMILETVGVELAQVAIENPSLLETLTLVRNTLNSSAPIPGRQLILLRKGIMRSMPEAAEEIRNETQVFHPINSKVLQALRESR